MRAVRCGTAGRYCQDAAVSPDDGRGKGGAPVACGCAEQAACRIQGREILSARKRNAKHAHPEAGAFAVVRRDSSQRALLYDAGAGCWSVCGRNANSRGRRNPVSCRDALRSLHGSGNRQDEAHTSGGLLSGSRTGTGTEVPVRRRTVGAGNRASHKKRMVDTPGNGCVGVRGFGGIQCHHWERGRAWQELFHAVRRRRAAACAWLRSSFNGLLACACRSPCDEDRRERFDQFDIVGPLAEVRG